MLRPGGHSSYQRSCYSGHKRFHCLIHQTLISTDGLILAMNGPIGERRHDLTVLRKSKWISALKSSLQFDNKQYYIFGDGAYTLQPWLQRPSLGILDDEKAAFNSQMSSVRVSVEHNYKDLKQLWTSQDFARRLMVQKAPIGLLYKAIGLLWNFALAFIEEGKCKSVTMS